MSQGCSNEYMFRAYLGAGEYFSWDGAPRAIEGIRICERVDNLSCFVAFACFLMKLMLVLSYAINAAL